MLRKLAAVALAGLTLAGCGSSPSSGPHLPTALPCPPTRAGMLCIEVIGGADRATVGDVIGYLASSGTSLDGKTWRLVLNRYSCDPQTGCRPAKAYPGPTRRGLPPAATSCRVTGTGTTVTAPTGCHGTLAQAMATHGDWAGFYRLADGRPERFASRVWLCVSEQVRIGRVWLQPRPAVARACSSVPPA